MSRSSYKRSPFLTRRERFLLTQVLFLAWRSRFSQDKSRFYPYKSHFLQHISRFSQDSSRSSSYTTRVPFLTPCSQKYTNYLSTSFKRTPVHSAVLMAAAPQLRPLTILILFISLLLLPAHCIVAVTECFGNLVFRSWTNNNKSTFLNEDAHNSPREEAESYLAVDCGIMTDKRTKQKTKCFAVPSIYPTSDCEMRPAPDFFSF